MGASAVEHRSGRASERHEMALGTPELMNNTLMITKSSANLGTRQNWVPAQGKQRILLKVSTFTELM